MKGSPCNRSGPVEGGYPGEVLRALRKFFLGGSTFTPKELTKADPRVAFYLTQSQAETRQAAWMFGAAATLSAGAAAWTIVSDAAAAAQVVLAIALLIAGGAASHWWSERGDRSDDHERVLTLGSIFYQSPEVLRGLLREEALDTFLRNLLRTVLRNDDLGNSVWRQAVSPLVHALDTGAYRERERYEISLRRLHKPRVVPVPSGRELRFDPDEYQELASEIAFRRHFPATETELWLGVVFDVRGGPQWFASGDLYFCLREYSPLAKREVDLMCHEAKATPVFGRRRRMPGVPRPWTTGFHRGALLGLAESFCRPGLELDGVELTADEVRLDRRGLGVRFAVPRSLQKKFGEDEWTEVRARLTIPVAKHVCALPVFFPEPTRGAEVGFEYGQAEIAALQPDMFLSGEKLFQADPVQARPDGRMVFSTDEKEWVFAGTGMTFSWRRTDVVFRPASTRGRGSTLDAVADETGEPADTK